MTDWIRDALRYRVAGEPVVRVTVAGLRGSGPREVGATMLVSARDTCGTIGGGELEYQSTKIAVRLLAAGRQAGSLHERASTARADGDDAKSAHYQTVAVIDGTSDFKNCRTNDNGAGAEARNTHDSNVDSGAIRANDNETSHGFLRRFPLGSNCGQCCGGVVDVLFQRLDSIACFDALVADWNNRNACALLTVLDGCGQPQNVLLNSSNRHAIPGLIEAKERNDVLRILDELRAAERIDTPGRGGHFVLVEPMLGKQLELAVFGAGHVGSAVVQLLSGLDARIRWVDSRRAVFPRTLPANVQKVENADPAREVTALSANAFFLVMTHSHALDFAITAAILRRADAAYCGLIGSIAKRRRFEARLRKIGFGDSDLKRLICPIGISGITGKQPQEIAIAVSAEILRRHEHMQSAASSPPARVQMLRSP